MMTQKPVLIQHDLYLQHGFSSAYKANSPFVPKPLHLAIGRYADSGQRAWFGRCVVC